MNIMLAATQFGLGTCPEVSPVLYPEVVREVLGIPDSKLIIVAIAIGYPDWNDPINQFRSLREPLEKIARWCGFG
jgi:nitroreductase